jgi:hypothetical protein
MYTYGALSPKARDPSISKFRQVPRPSQAGLFSVEVDLEFFSCGLQDRARARIRSSVLLFSTSLDENGAVAGSSFMRDIPLLTSAATSSIPSWKFARASRRVKSGSSVIRVAVVFRPLSYLAADPGFSPVPPNEDPIEATRDTSRLAYCPFRALGIRETPLYPAPSPCRSRSASPAQ